MRPIKILILTSVVFITSSLTVKAQIISDLPANSMSHQSFNETNPKTIESEISSFDFDNNDVKENLKNQKVIYFELLGSGGFYSVNYEHFIKDRVSLRGGISYIYQTLILPVSINKIKHTKGDSFFETSIGSSFVFYDDDNDDSDFIIITGIGFRGQPIGRGPFTRFTFNPSLKVTNGINFGMTVGVSFGFSFK